MTPWSREAASQRLFLLLALGRGAVLVEGGENRVAVLGLDGLLSDDARAALLLPDGVDLLHVLRQVADHVPL